MQDENEDDARSAADLRPQEQAPARLRAGLAGGRRHERDVDFHDGADGGAVGLVGEEKCTNLTGKLIVRKPEKSKAGGDTGASLIVCMT